MPSALLAALLSCYSPCGRWVSRQQRAALPLTEHPADLPGLYCLAVAIAWVDALHLNEDQTFPYSRTGATAQLAAAGYRAGQRVLALPPAGGRQGTLPLLPAQSYPLGYLNRHSLAAVCQPGARTVGPRFCRFRLGCKTPAALAEGLCSLPASSIHLSPAPFIKLW